MRLIFSALLTCSLLASCSGDEPAGPSSFRLGTELITEGAQTSERSVKIIRQGNLNSAVTLDYEITHVGTQESVDLIATSGTLEFLKGSAEAIIPVVVTGDNYTEITEIFKINLTTSTSDFELQVSIIDDDEPPAILSYDDGFLSPVLYPSMKSVWSDEFEGTSLNLQSWTYDIGDGCPNLCDWGNNELQLYGDQPSVINVSGGNLTIRAINDNGIYRSARIKTKGKVELTYGRIDIRAKLPKGKGVWPAMWMLGSNIDTNPWPGCGEIDIMELIGSEPSTVHGTVHYQDNATKGYRTSTGSTTITGETFADKFHVFSAVWDRGRIDWYLDNKLYGSFNYPAESGSIFRLPYYFLMNVAVGGRWPGSPDNTTVFPQEMVIDYIRVFQ